MIHLTPEQHVFVTERHLATLTTLRADGSPHVVPVGFTWDPDAGVVRVITSGTSVKAKNAAQPGADGQPSRAVVCQVEGGRWITLEGPVTVLTEPEPVREAEQRYARRYKVPRENPARVVVVITPDRVMSSSYMAR
ncbi:Pyridoxamine 5'-phosphate oxidase [Sanguibacter keddieii DSM 10542]|uniref:Pyridoxamine 5'-phosphate oxidase n=1 Tax=Sanguibacter keddieii (strain ATCC 51767 / DSM 10542 / NCFB 3025 / ST-74) TaxID=446469 RepID=D1BIK5_SANKS|nr:PPOX class F420-dependent oxidoreductase [Sanguibacter keddieii]ACZ22182.1 Pyridoxamine 5'-phosphate oxidase [Sanguibacter keddieii DSM 10542]